MQWVCCDITRRYQLKKLIKLMSLVHSLILSLVIVGFGVVSFEALATTSGLSLGQVSTQITGSFDQITRFMTGGSYLAGIAFSIGAIMKFKQHKDNPTQIPIGTPIALLGIAAALLFLPSVLSTAGQTIFSGGITATPTGTVY